MRHLLLRSANTFVGNNIYSAVSNVSVNKNAMNLSVWHICQFFFSHSIEMCAGPVFSTITKKNTCSKFCWCVCVHNNSTIAVILVSLAVRLFKSMESYAFRHTNIHIHTQTQLIYSMSLVANYRNSIDPTERREEKN